VGFDRSGVKSGESALTTIYADLSPCRAVSHAPEVLAVGWLAMGRPFSTGPVDRAIYRTLLQLCNDPWEPVDGGGWRECDVCQFDAPQFKGNLFVPYQGKVYVTPTSITHHIAVHWYQPPAIFLEAVMQCPPTRSIEFKRALQRNGGASLLANTA
jgi:hypothetical protein